ncbi:uncharacterized protein LOC113209330 [Frankliniella occidentalis]|uniref:Uncharacterized protein LOC113209330 n=1 Tax=Frankliniella occidentalis TaxID=133901 RepID=A0A9C6XA74_FRAOC|nr:uncharacterized protein LOC113209330 [Frankliniella occidentalis]
MCEPPKYPWLVNLRASHFNPYKPKELQLLTGNVTGVNVTVDDGFWIKLMLALRSNNQWKDNYLVFTLNDKACTNFKVHMPGLYKILFGPNLNLKEECLLKPGTYNVNNTPIDWTFPKFPVMPYGRFKVKLTMGKAEQLATCLFIELRHMPKLE